MLGVSFRPFPQPTPEGTSGFRHDRGPQNRFSMHECPGKNTNSPGHSFSPGPTKASHREQQAGNSTEQGKAHALHSRVGRNIPNCGSCQVGRSVETVISGCRQAISQASTDATVKGQFHLVLQTGREPSTERCGRKLEQWYPRPQAGDSTPETEPCAARMPQSLFLKSSGGDFRRHTWSLAPSDPSHHEPTSGQLHPGHRTCHSPLYVLGKTTAASHPREGSLHYPTT